MTDNEIIDLYFSRSENAISATSEKYGGYLNFIAFNILHDESDSEECVNDAYLKTWNTIPPKRPERLQTFIGRITRNLALNRYEKMNAQKRGGGQTALVLEELSECIPDKNNVEDIVDSEAVKAALDEFLGSLGTEARKLFVRRYWYMDSVKSIAEEYGMTQSKVKVTLFRTREKLKIFFEKEGITI